MIRFYYIVTYCNNIKLKNYLIELLLPERFFLLYFNEISEYLILPFYSILFNFFSISNNVKDVAQLCETSFIIGSF